MKLWSLLLAAALLPAQGQEKPQKSIREVMEESIAKQRESLRKQVRAAKPETDPSWYTVPWPATVEVQPIQPAAGPEGNASGPVTTTSALRFDDCPPFSPPFLEKSLDDHIRQAAGRGGYSPNLLRAVIRQESGFQPCAVSSKGALGLMQLMPATAADMGVSNPLDAVENLYGGARWLGALLERYQGNVPLALGAYNAGPGKVDLYGGIPPYKETQDFVRNILFSTRETELPPAASFRTFLPGLGARTAPFALGGMSLTGLD